MTTKRRSQKGQERSPTSKAGRSAKPQATQDPTAPRTRPRLAVAHVVAEYWPYARTGGLAEAVRGIATFQAATGVPTLVFMPLYGQVRERHPELEPYGKPFMVRVGPRVEQARLFQAPRAKGEPRIFLIHHSGHFGREGIYGDGNGDYRDNHLRFAFFSMAALRALPHVWRGDLVLHPHDWHGALAAIYLRSVLAGRDYYDRVACVFSVHNAGFQGHFPYDILWEIGIPDRLFHYELLEWYGRVNLMKGALVYSDFTTTVSPTHAHELRTTAGGFGLHDQFTHLQDRLVGILNGIDMDVWDPATDPQIPARYSRDNLTGKAECKRSLQEEYALSVSPRIPLFGMTARLVGQKGLDLILGGGLLHRTDAQFIFLGKGESRYHEALARAAAYAPNRIAVDFDFTEAKEHRLLAGADILLMPSLYEPCGLTQMRAQRYGDLPVGRRVGGLADTIEDQVTGFLFDEYSHADLDRAARRATHLYQDESAWRWHMLEAMKRDFGWTASGERYLEIYRWAIAAHAGAGAPNTAVHRP